MRKFLLSIFALVLVFAVNAQTTIYDIQYTTDGSGDSPLNGTDVTVTGVVVAIHTNSSGTRQGFYLQDAPGAWHGIYVYEGSAPGTCVVGDNVTVSGTVAEYNGLTEIATLTNTTINSNGNSYTINDVTTGGLQSEQWEGCIVKVTNATCLSGSNGNYTVNDGSGDLIVYKQLYQALSLAVGTAYDITGVVTWYNTGSLFELYPRNADDVVVHTGIVENSVIVNIYPNPVVNTLNISENANVKVYNISGVELMNATNVKSIDFSNLEAGVYFIQLETSEGISTEKVIKK